MNTRSNGPARAPASAARRAPRRRECGRASPTPARRKLSRATSAWRGSTARSCPARPSGAHAAQQRRRPSSRPACRSRRRAARRPRGRAPPGGSASSAATWMSGRPAARAARADLGQHLVLGRVDARDVLGQLRVGVSERLVHALHPPAAEPERQQRLEQHQHDRRGAQRVPQLQPPPGRGAARAARARAIGALVVGEARGIGFAGVQRDRERRVGALVDGAVARAPRARGRGPARRSRRTSRCAGVRARPRAPAGVSQRDSPPGFTTSTRRSSAPSTISRLPPTVTVAVASPDGAAAR